MPKLTWQGEGEFHLGTGEILEFYRIQMARLWGRTGVVATMGMAHRDEALWPNTELATLGSLH